MEPLTPPTIKKTGAVQATGNMYNDVIGMTRGLLDETYNSSVQSINTGFALASALAWNEAVKTVIQKYFSTSNVTRYQLMYAMVVTILSAIVFMLTKRLFKPSITKEQIKPIIGYMR